MQAFINTARKVYEKIEQGVFDVSNEVGCFYAPARMVQFFQFCMHALLASAHGTFGRSILNSKTPVGPNRLQ